MRILTDLEYSVLYRLNDGLDDDWFLSSEEEETCEDMKVLGYVFSYVSEDEDEDEEFQQFIFTSTSLGKEALRIYESVKIYLSKQ